MIDFKKYIRNIPDFPVKGIQFKDITTLLREGDVFSAAVDQMYAPFKEDEIDKVVGIESRGFIFGGAMAYKLNAGFIPVRKPGKLPAETLSEEYQLEYGTDSLEVHLDGIDQGDRVLVIDDLLATGGTAEATCKLIEKLGGIIVGVTFLIELTSLKGRARLERYRVHTVVQYDI